LTALRAARLFLSKPEDRRSTEQALVAHLLRIDPIITGTYQQVQAFCRMVRQHHSDDIDAWIREVQHIGVKELRAFAKGLLKDAAAARAGLSLVWSNGPTEGFIHRLQLVKRQGYGRAGVDFCGTASSRHPPGRWRNARCGEGESWQHVKSGQKERDKPEGYGVGAMVRPIPTLVPVFIENGTDPGCRGENAIPLHGRREGRNRGDRAL
jgi:hypothetical protein